MSSLQVPLWGQKHHYDLADQDEETHDFKRPEDLFNRLQNSTWLRLLVCIGISLGWTYFVGSTSYRVGQHSIQAEYQKQNIDGMIIYIHSVTLSQHTKLIYFPVQMVHHSFVYNDSFPKPPTSNVNIHHDQPWRTLYPEHGPYFNKTATNPERWTFSVFHQLHCVVSYGEIPILQDLG
jgi:hypothetical protein